MHQSARCKMRCGRRERSQEVGHFNDMETTKAVRASYSIDVALRNPLASALASHKTQVRVNATAALIFVFLFVVFYSYFYFIFLFYFPLWAFACWFHFECSAAYTGHHFIIHQIRGKFSRQTRENVVSRFSRPIPTGASVFWHKRVRKRLFLLIRRRYYVHTNITIDESTLSHKKEEASPSYSAKATQFHTWIGYIWLEIVM